MQLYQILTVCAFLWLDMVRSKPIENYAPDLLNSQLFSGKDELTDGFENRYPRHHGYGDYGYGRGGYDHRGYGYDYDYYENHGYGQHGRYPHHHHHHHHDSHHHDRHHHHGHHHHHHR